MALVAGCGTPPQILEIAPQRGAVDVHSDAPVQVRFDRAMDRGSVATRFHVLPSVRGTLRWTGTELTFDHVPFSPHTQYQVSLDAGYRDAHSVVNALRHSWSFQTEAPPLLAGASPGQGDEDVDPATYLTLSFSREMDPSSLVNAISLTPGTAVTVRQDPNDPRRVILAPQALLEPRQTYSVAVTQDARDVDGNRLGVGSLVSFTTGDFRPLHHWIGFIGQSSPAGPGDGVWIVNENRFPRQVVNSPVDAFTWSPDGSRLLLRSPAGGWTDQALDGVRAVLPVHGQWAAYLAPGAGYAFLDSGTLQLLSPAGSGVPVATGVTSASVAPGGLQLAFVVGDAGGVQRSSEIDGYDVELHARFRLQAEPEPVTGLAWSPDGQSLAYRLEPADQARQQVRVRSLHQGTVTTVAIGAFSGPAWQADGRHLVLTAQVESPAGPESRAFRFAVDGSSPQVVDPSQALPSDQAVPVLSVSPSPDGHQLAFVSDADGSPAIWLMNADGTGVAELTQYDPTRFPYSCRSPAWTPS